MNEETLHMLARFLGAERQWLLRREAHDDSVSPEMGSACTRAVAQGWAQLPAVPEPIVRRRVFTLRRLSTPSKDSTLLATVGEATSMAGGDGKFALLLLVTLVGEAPTISGVYEVCRACVALGSDGMDTPCLECDGLGWEH